MEILFGKTTMPMGKITKIELLATPTHSRYYHFFPSFFPPSGGQKFFVAHKFFCLTRFSLISLTGHVAKETPGKEKVKIQWENCRCLWPTAITAARKAASKLISCAAFKLSFTFCLRLQLRLSKTFI